MKSNNGFRYLTIAALVVASSIASLLIIWMPLGAPPARADFFSNPPIPSFVPAPLIAPPCPSGVTCIYQNDNTSCPAGKICTSVSATQGCPALYICYKMTNAPVAIATSTATSTAPAGPSLSIASLSQYYGSAGSSIYMTGTLFGTSSIVVLAGGPSGYTVINPSVISSSTLSFVVPASVAAGTYSLSVYNLTGAPSNAVSFIVISSSVATSTASAPANTPAPDASTNASNDASYNPSASDYSVPVNTGINAYVNALTQQASTVQNPYATAQTGASTKFTIGSRVQTTASLRVRSSASIQGAILSTTAVGTQGSVTGGSIYADGHNWWLVSYDSGAAGWSAEDYLVLAGSAQSVSSVSSVATPAKTTNCYTLKNDLSYGMGTGTTAYLARDISNLHIAFTLQGFSISDYEKSGSTFGASTLDAAVKFQDKYGIRPDAGYVGPITRAKLNSMYGCY